MKNMFVKYRLLSIAIMFTVMVSHNNVLLAELFHAVMRKSFGSNFICGSTHI